MKIVSGNKLFLAVFSAIIFVIFLPECAYLQQNYEQENSFRKKDKKDYYNKIVQNEIEILKYRLQEKEKAGALALEKQKNDYEIKIGELQNRLSGLEEEKQKQKELLQQDSSQQQNQPAEKAATVAQDEKLESHRQMYEQALLQKDKENELKIQKITEELEKKQQEFEASYQEKLTEKYKKLDEALREKDNLFSQQLAEKDAAIKQFQEDSDKREAVMRQALAKKETELNQQFEQEKNKFTGENEALKKASEQLRIYLSKLKEESALKDTIINEKNAQIEVLNKKIAFFSGDEAVSELKAAEVLKEEVTVVKNENNRLKQELQESRDAMAQFKDEYEKKLAQQRNALASAEEQSNVNLEKNSDQWQKKLNLSEVRHEKEIEELNSKYEKDSGRYEGQIRKLTEELRSRVSETEALKLKLASSKDNQVYLLEMLANKASKMAKEDSSSLNKTREFKSGGFEKKEAKAYFDKAMQSVMDKNYQKAKSEIEQAISLEPDNEAAKNVLLNLNFLLEKKKK